MPKLDTVPRSHWTENKCISVVHDTSTDLKLAIFVLQSKCLLMSDLSPITISHPPLLPSKLFPISHLFSIIQAFNTSFLSQRDLNSDPALSSAFSPFQFAIKGKLYISSFLQKVDVWNPFHFDSVKSQLLVLKFFTNHVYIMYSCRRGCMKWHCSTKFVIYDFTFIHCPNKTLILGNSDVWAQRHFTIILVLPIANFMPVHILHLCFIKSHFWDPWLLHVSQNIRTMAIQEL